MEVLHECILCGSSAIECTDRLNLIATRRTCGLPFDNPRPSTDEIRAFWRALSAAVRHNFYETILMVGKKP